MGGGAHRGVGVRCRDDPRCAAHVGNGTRHATYLKRLRTGRCADWAKQRFRLDNPRASFVLARLVAHPAPLLLRLGLLLSAAAVVLGIAGPLTILRTAMWTTMVAEFRAEGDGLWRAIDRTVSGESPCEWCLVLDEAERAESRGNQIVLAASRIDFPEPEQDRLILRAVPTRQPAAGDPARTPPEGVAGDIRSVPRGRLA